MKCQIAQHVFKRNFDRFLIAGHSSIIIIIIIIIITQQQQQQQQQQAFISHKMKLQWNKKNDYNEQAK